MQCNQIDDKMRKKLFIIAALLVAAFCAKAQRADTQIGAAVQYSCNIQQTLKHNVGADILVLRDLTDLVTFRAIAEVNGFIPNGFDRYSKVTVGVQCNLEPLYVFVDMGPDVNPSGKEKVGFSIDGGIGTRYAIGNNAIIAETGFETARNGHWIPAAFVRVGYVFGLFKD